MVFDRLVCMADRDLAEIRSAPVTVRPEQQFQVHHVVYDDLEIAVPGLDASRLVVETRSERRCGP